MSRDDVTADLRRLMGERCLTAPEAKQGYERDWTGSYTGHASAVVLPESSGEVAQILQLARIHLASVVPQGGNTGLAGGAVPVDGAILLSTALLDDVEVDPASCHVVAGAGATLEGVQKAAAVHGLMLPVDLGSRSQATVGGLVATNAGGLLAHRHGPVGRWLRGAVFVTADGQVVDRLDPPRKESAGFELFPLLPGSEGTLAVITRVRLQLVAGPLRRAGLLMSGDDLVDLTNRVLRLERTHGPADAVEGWFARGVAGCRQRGLSRYPVDPEHECHVLAQWSGDDELVERLLEDMAAATGSDECTVAVAVDESDLRLLWTAREMHPLLVAGHDRPVVKVDTAVGSARLLPTLRAEVEDAVLAVDAAAELFFFGHVMEGSLHVNVATVRPERVLSAVCDTAVALGGTVSAEHGIGRLKLPWMTQLRAGPDLAVMRSVKQALDPAGLLNPGVLLPAEA